MARLRGDPRRAICPRPNLGGSDVETVRPLPPLALRLSEWRAIGLAMKWTLDTDPSGYTEAGLRERIRRFEEELHDIETGRILNDGKES